MKNDTLKYLPTKGQTGTEEALQVACANYLRLNRIRFFHCPNGGNRDAVTGAKLKAQGVQRGVPDLIITDLLLVVELKVGTNKPTPEQIEWLEHYRAIGWGAWWVNSFDEFIILAKNVKKQQGFWLHYRSIGMKSWLVNSFDEFIELINNCKQLKK